MNNLNAYNQLLLFAVDVLNCIASTCIVSWMKNKQQQLWREWTWYTQSDVLHTQEKHCPPNTKVANALHTPNKRWYRLWKLVLVVHTQTTVVCDWLSHYVYTMNLITMVDIPCRPPPHSWSEAYEYRRLTELVSLYRQIIISGGGCGHSQAPHNSPSVWMDLTWASTSFMSVSSSHTLTSHNIVDLATTTSEGAVDGISY